MHAGQTILEVMFTASMVLGPDGPDPAGATAVASATPTAGGLGLTKILCSIAIIAFIAAAPVLFFAIRVRKSAFALLSALLGGVSASGLVAAAGTKVAGLSVPLTWADAALFAMGWFAIGAVAWAGAACLALWVVVWRPLNLRFGKLHGVRALAELWDGLSAFQKWLRDTVGHATADETWDEFACAFNEVAILLQGVDQGTEFGTGVLKKLGPPTDKPQSESEAVVRLLTLALLPAVERLTSRLSHTTLSFTVWRVAEDGENLEHLLSLPVIRSSGGHGKKQPLPIWYGPGRGSAGSLASCAMLDQEFKAMTAAERGKYPCRGLGKSYDAVAAMPVPSDPDQGPPWAVICLESRDGVLPVHSDAVKSLLARLAFAIDKTCEVVRKRTIPMPKTSSMFAATGSSVARARVDDLPSRLVAPQSATPTGDAGKGVMPPNPDVVGSSTQVDVKLVGGMQSNPPAAANQS